MDLETENRIAAILLKEAAELRRQADREGVHIYCQQPKARGRPNSRFLTATVLGVQQANRAVEVNEMWRVRQKELELNDRLKGRSKNGTKHSRSYGDSSNSSRRTSEKHETDLSSSSSSSKIIAESSYLGEDEGLEKFLQSRFTCNRLVKRGRGSVGSRMDETGPYLPTNSHSPEMLSTYPIAREHRVTLGPEKPSSLTSDESFSDEELREHRRKKEKDLSKSSENKHRRKHKSKEKSIDKKRKREEKRRKYR